jgi:hypothetical protein
MSITKNKRFHVFERDGFTCQYCGAKAADDELQIDHITPKSLGGTDDVENLVTACQACNSGKGKRSVRKPEHLQELLDRLGDLRKRRNALKKANAAIEEILAERERTAWVLIRHWADARNEWDEEKRTCSRELYNHVKAMLVEFAPEKLADCMTIALRKFHSRREDDALRYLYGILRTEREKRLDGVG